MAIEVDSYEVERRPLILWPSLCAKAYDSLFIQNAGGNSIVSEAVSIEYFNRRFGAEDIRLEMDIEYWIDYKKVDFTCIIDGERCGVSVTRAMAFPDPETFTLEYGRELFQKKIRGLIMARNCTNDSDSFLISFLHIWCQTERIARLMNEAMMGEDLEGIRVILTVTDCNLIYSTYFNINYFAKIAPK